MSSQTEKDQDKKNAALLTYRGMTRQSQLRFPKSATPVLARLLTPFQGNSDFSLSPYIILRIYINTLEDYPEVAREQPKAPI